MDIPMACAVEGFLVFCQWEESRHSRFVAWLGRPVPEGFTVAKEGQARILQQSNETFYNPAQVHHLQE